MKKRFFLLLLITITTSAKMLNYQTTRLKSTGGAGVASLLMDEATISNPAPLAFFNIGAVYFEKSGAEVTDVNNNTSELDNYAFIASDSSKSLKGSISYIKAENSDNKLKQLNFAFASLMGKKSSAGIAYRDTSKEFTYKKQRYKEDYKQLVPGVFHGINANVLLGLVAIDPLRENPVDSKIVMGLQFNLLDYITLILDAGSDHESTIEKSSVYKAGMQVKVLNDLFLRFGTYDDKALKEKGSGFGIGWVQPRLVLNFAVKNIELKEDKELKQEDEDIKETSFSLSYRF